MVICRHQYWEDVSPLERQKWLSKWFLALFKKENDLRCAADGPAGHIQFPAFHWEEGPIARCVAGWILGILALQASSSHAKRPLSQFTRSPITTRRRTADGRVRVRENASYAHLLIRQPPPLFIPEWLTGRSRTRMANFEPGCNVYILKSLQNLDQNLPIMASRINHIYLIF
jgi:hypothetical protein